MDRRYTRSTQIDWPFYRTDKRTEEEVLVNIKDEESNKTIFVGLGQNGSILLSMNQKPRCRPRSITRKAKEKKVEQPAKRRR